MEKETLRIIIRPIIFVLSISAVSGILLPIFMPKQFINVTKSEIELFIVMIATTVAMNLVALIVLITAYWHYLKEQKREQGGRPQK